MWGIQDQPRFHAPAVVHAPWLFGPREIAKVEHHEKRYWGGDRFYSYYLTFLDPVTIAAPSTNKPAPPEPLAHFLDGLPTAVPTAAELQAAAGA